MALALYDYAVSVRHPILHYGYMPGCPACAMMSPVVDRVIGAANGTIELRKYDVTVPGEVFPLPVSAVPALALEVRDHGIVPLPAPTQRQYTDIELNSWIWNTFRQLRATRGPR